MTPQIDPKGPATMLLLLPLVLRTTMGGPIPRIRFVGETDVRLTPLQRAVRYLNRFGYYGRDVATRFPKALSALQDFFGLSKSGKLDHSTMAALERPRCGLPDLGDTARWERWQHTHLTYRVEDYVRDLEADVVDEILFQAAAIWMSIVPMQIKSLAQGQPDVIIRFTESHGFESAESNEVVDVLSLVLRDAEGENLEILFNERQFWSFGEGRVVKTRLGNAEGDFCMFPFTFEGQEFTSCTKAGRKDGLLWCATTDNYDRDRLYGYCPQEGLFTTGGNAEGKPCAFPFVYGTRTYNICTTDGRSDQERWCATTDNYNTDLKYGFCPNSVLTTVGGNSGKSPCFFPFNFLGQSYNACTSVGRFDGKSWCSTTADYDNDHKWGFCTSSGISLLLAAVHAFGHVLGLSHNTDPTSIMFPLYSYQRSFHLSPADINALQAIFGIKGEEPAESPIQPEPPSDICRLSSKIDAIASLNNHTIIFVGITGTSLKQASCLPGLALFQAAGRVGQDKSRPRQKAKVKSDCSCSLVWSNMWRIPGLSNESHFPEPISNLGLNLSTFRVDAALYIDSWKLLLLLDGELLWRYNMQQERMDLNAPEKIQDLFPQLPGNIDAAFEQGGYLYFVKGVRYWVFEGQVLMHEGFFMSDWLGCDK
uniref:72 kDa type IV collagenase-like isoform X2 n=1 Tax=Myxine glutinosa TaxID=7769 RepID=UPI00358F34FB